MGPDPFFWGGGAAPSAAATSRGKRKGRERSNGAERKNGACAKKELKREICQLFFYFATLALRKTKHANGLNCCLLLRQHTPERSYELPSFFCGLCQIPVLPVPRGKKSKNGRKEICLSPPPPRFLLDPKGSGWPRPMVSPFSLSLSLSLPLAFRGRRMTHFSASVRANVINKSQGGIARPNVLGGGRFFFFLFRISICVQLFLSSSCRCRRRRQGRKKRTLECTAHSPPPQVSHIRRNALKTWTKPLVCSYRKPPRIFRCFQVGRMSAHVSRVRKATDGCSSIFCRNVQFSDSRKDKHNFTLAFLAGS